MFITDRKVGDTIVVSGKTVVSILFLQKEGKVVTLSIVGETGSVVVKTNKFYKLLPLIEVHPGEVVILDHTTEITYLKSTGLAEAQFQIEAPERIKIIIQKEAS